VRICTLSHRLTFPQSHFRKLQVQIPSSKFQVPSSKFQVPNSKFQVPSSKFQIPSSKFQIPSSKFQIPSSKFQIPSSKFQVQRSKFQEEESEKVSRRESENLHIISPSHFPTISLSQITSTNSKFHVPSSKFLNFKSLQHFLIKSHINIPQFLLCLKKKI